MAKVKVVFTAEIDRRGNIGKTEYQFIGSKRPLIFVSKPTRQRTLHLPSVLRQIVHENFDLEALNIGTRREVK